MQWSIISTIISTIIATVHAMGASMAFPAREFIRAQPKARAAFNHAWDEYAGRGPDGREETAHKVAWSAVKKSDRKDEKSGKWLNSE